jgi:hypothetical protein
MIRRRSSHINLTLSDVETYMSRGATAVVAEAEQD